MIGILLAEDHHVVRAALVALLERESDMRIVAQVGRGDEVLPMARNTRPNVAVIDIDLPGIDGLSAAAQLHAELGQCRTLMLTALGGPGTLHRALEAGVSGFLSKDASPVDLVAAIRTVHAGRRVLDPELAAYAWTPASKGPLSTRELEVLQLCASGADIGEISRTLFLASGTVRNYLTQIVWKLGARNRMDAVRIARESGWLS